jgi:hypothetical protein
MLAHYLARFSNNAEATYEILADLLPGKIEIEKGGGHNSGHSFIRGKAVLTGFMTFKISGLALPDGLSRRQHGFKSRWGRHIISGSQIN